jgi:hypothetical protein
MMSAAAQHAGRMECDTREDIGKDSPIAVELSNTRVVVKGFGFFA